MALIERAQQAWVQFAADGKISTLETSIDFWQQVLEDPRFKAAGAASQAAVLNNAANAFFSRFQMRGNREDLERALSGYRSAVSASPREAIERPSRLSNLGAALLEHYRLSNDVAELESAIDACAESVETARTGADFPRFRLHLAAALAERYVAQGSSDDRQRAIEEGETALASTPASPLRGRRMGDFGRTLIRCHVRSRASSDLHRAIDLFEGAMGSLPPNAPLLAALGMALLERYGDSGDFDDIVAAERVLENAITATGSEHSHLLVNPLARCAYEHYRVSGDLASFDRAVDLLRGVVEQTGRTGGPANILMLATLLRERYFRRRRLADLHEAVETLEREVERGRDDHDAEMLNNFGLALLDRYSETLNEADLHRAVTVFRQSADASDGASQAIPFNNLGLALRHVYIRTNALEDLEGAITAHEQAVERTSAGSPNRAAFLSNLGNALTDRYRLLGNRDDWTRAVRAYREAAELGLGKATDAALRSALNWGTHAFEHRDWRETADAHAVMRVAIDRLIEAQLERADKEVWLRATQGFAANAAFAMASLGDTGAAVNALESGQAQLLANALQSDQTELDALAATHSDLAERYRRAGAAVRRTEQGGSGLGSLPVADARAARTELDDTLQAIRRIPGHEHFMLPSGDREVRAAVASLPVGTALAYLATTPAGSLALIVTQTEEVLWLEPATSDLDELLFRTKKTSDAMERTADARGRALTETRDETLTWLGTHFMAPLAARLRALRIEHVILVPNGRLSLLPLHAAQYEHGDASHSFLDELTVSYAPNARVLSAASRSMAKSEGRFLLAGVGNPLPHPAPLRAAEAELRQLAELFPEHCLPLYREEATRGALVPLLANATHVHFACHGRFDIASPLASRLELAHAEELTLRDLLDGTVPLDSARIVVLSACESALTDFDTLPDELVGLPAGFLQAGVPGVVGTLWSIGDLATALVMVRFYELLRGVGTPPLEPAEALRTAQRWLRDSPASAIVAYLNDHPRIRAVFDDPDVGRPLTWLESVAKSDPARRVYEEPFHWAPFVFLGR